jgi:hypothetical protein
LYFQYEDVGAVPTSRSIEWLKPTYNKTECVNTIAIRLWDTKAGYHSITCERRVKRNSIGIQPIEDRAVLSSRSKIIKVGEKVKPLTKVWP